MISIDHLQNERNYRFTYIFSIIGGSTSAVFAISHLLIVGKSSILGYIELACSIVAFLNLYYLSKTRNTEHASNIVLLIMYVLLISILAYGGVGRMGLLWYATFPILALTLKDLRTGIWWVCGLAFAIMFYFILSQASALPLAYSATELFLLACMVLVITAMLYFNKNIIQQSESRLVDSLAELNLANQILEVEQRKEGEMQSELIRLKMAIEHAYDFVTITDPEGTILYANPSVERITGYSAVEALGTKAGKLWGGLMPTAYYQKLWQTIKIDKQQFSGEIQNKRKNGEVYTAHVSITPILGAGQNVAYFVCIERDITKEKELEKTKSEFLSFAAHQLRTPVTSIKWYAQILKDGTLGQLTDPQLEVAGKIEESSRRMQEIVTEFLTITHLDSGDIKIIPQPVSLKAALQKAVTEAQPLLNSQQLNCCHAKNQNLDITVNVDPVHFHQILLNFITNAAKYTPKHGDIEVVVEQGHGVTIKVIDSGIGIPEAELPLVFEKFFRASNAKSENVSGTGLGLYFVKKVVDLAGGSVNITSQSGKGTTVSLTIPPEGWKAHEA